MHQRTHYIPKILATFAAFALLVLSCTSCGGQPAPSEGGEFATATPLAPTATATIPAPTATDVPPTFTPTSTPTHTPTPSEAGGGVEPTAEAASACAGFAGELEVRVLVGPAAAVGMEPVAVGRVPFAVTTDLPPYLVEGAAPMDYEASEGHDWGSYTVVLSMDLAVSGECSGAPGSEALELVLDMAGEQYTTVVVEGMTWEYPWSGSHSLDLSLPLIEGASGGGEGWSVVLHIAAS